MNIKIRAAINTAKVLAFCTLASLTFMGILYTVPLEYIGMALALVAMVMAAKLCYDTEKSKLETLERLNKIS